MGLCSQQVLRDVASEERVVGSRNLLAELVRIDTKNRAESRQIRNIDLAKRVLQGKELSIEEQYAAAEKSIGSAPKYRIVGAFAKTLSQLCKAIKAGSPHVEKLVQVTLDALSDLDDETLLKIGPDLANFLTLAHEHNSDSQSKIQTMLIRIGRKDNELVVFALRNKEDFLLETPSLLNEIVFDLVKYYFKSQ